MGEELERYRGMSVREFLEKHSDGFVSMMTPGGYVDLNPEQIKRLLKGDSTQGHLGERGTEMEIPALELLEQVICNCNQSDGEWCMLTEVVQERQEEEMGMRMC